MTKKCPPCRGLCEFGDYCKHMTKAKKILDAAREGKFVDPKEIEWALQITGDIPTPEQVELEIKHAQRLQNNQR